MQTNSSKIILGTVQFGLAYGINNTLGKPDYKTVSAILDYAHSNQIQMLDTAEAYGNAQEIIGRYHAESSNRFEVITKFSPVRNDLMGSLRAQVIQNIYTMRVEKLYGYMFHSFRDFETYFETYKEEIKKLKEEGFIHRFGVSVYSNQELETLLKYDTVDLIQLPFNILDNNNQRGKLIEQAKQKGIEIHTRSVFLQGLFFKPLNELPEKLTPLQPYLQQINILVKQNKLSMTELSLNYALQQPNIDYVLFGAESLQQTEDNIKAIQIKLNHEIVNQINTHTHVKETELLNPANW